MKKIALLVLLVLASGTPIAFADSIYLKDGSIVRGSIVQEEDGSIMIDTGDSWKRLDRSSIELIRTDTPVQQEPRPASPATSGFFAGLQFPYCSMENNFDEENGITTYGVGVIVGYRINPFFSLEIDFARSGQNEASRFVSFAEYSLNLKVRSLPEHTVHPFLFAGIGNFSLRNMYDQTFYDRGYNVGAGMDIEMGAKTTLGLAAIRKIISYGTSYDTISGDVLSIRIDLTRQF